MDFELRPPGMANEPELARIRALAQAANARKLSVARAATEAVGPADEVGSYFLVGTRRSKPAHIPPYGFLYYSRSVPSWQLLEDPHENTSRALVITKLAKVATLSALFGDINENIRDNLGSGRSIAPVSRLDEIITTNPRPHYGWVPDPFEEEGIALHARPELINHAPQLTGFIDIVAPDPELQPEPLPQFGHGMYIARVVCRTVATIDVLGRDLPEIRAIQYPESIN